MQPDDRAKGQTRAKHRNAEAPMLVRDAGALNARHLVCDTSISSIGALGMPMYLSQTNST